MSIRLLTILLLFIVFASSAWASSHNAVYFTKHNLSVTGPGTVKADLETRVCVFCHTPHKAGKDTPLWNRDLSTANYIVYDSSTLDATLGQPDGTSKLCLSCHDGTIALGKVNNLWGVATTISIQGTGVGGTMPEGAGETVGFTRRLGTDLSNDHPISFVYDSALIDIDAELVDPAASSYVYINLHAPLPLDENGKLQCTTCHNPHLDTRQSRNAKFLRMPMVQTVETATEGIDAIICVNCHDKQDWVGSSHQKAAVADEVYGSGNYLGKTGAVWQNACLNCHDTHTVQGSRRLLLEGTDDINRPKQNGNSAIEETCYLCHTGSAETVLDTTVNQVQDIKMEFSRFYHHPVVTLEQADTFQEAHDIKNASMEEITTESFDFLTGVPNLGLNKRHVECTDCHNPHRMVKNSRADGTGIETQSTHDHTAPHTNDASGVFRGIWGVEPIYTGTDWDTWPSGADYDKRGTPDVVLPVLFEYQVCLKCHSSYAYGSNPPPSPSAPENEILDETDQAKDFNPNNQSFHPVIATTGRILVDRAITVGNPFLFPFTEVGTQTMYCSDCHGRDALITDDSGPQGTHGSAYPFILKGRWDFFIGTGDDQIEDGLCYRCHDSDVYHPSGTATGAGVSGFSDGTGNLHISDDGVTANRHLGWTDRITGGRITCMTCHTAVPHGWKKKGLLVESTDPVPYKTSATTLTLPLFIPSSGSWTCLDCHP